MAEEPTNIVLIKLDEIRGEQEVMNAKMGAMADTLVGIKRDIQTLDARVDSLELSIHRLQADVGAIAVAVGEHTRRLEQIGKKLDRTHA
jgi:hypothetical protein